MLGELKKEGMQESLSQVRYNNNEVDIGPVSILNVFQKEGQDKGGSQSASCSNH